MKERIKTIALVGNILLMALLFCLSITVSVEMSENMGPLYTVSRWLRGETAPRQEVARTAVPTAYPARIVAVKEEGLAVYFQQADLEQQFEKMRASFDEALGSVQQPQAISPVEYRQLVLGSQGFLLDYDADMPLYALRIWAGASESEGFEQTLRQLTLAIGAKDVTVAFRSGDGRYYRCATMANPAGAAGVLADCAVDETVFFAGQAGGADNPYEALAPEEVVQEALLTLPSFDTRVPAFFTADKTPEDLLKCFSMNPYMESHYQNGDAVTYVQGNYNLRLNQKSGRLEFSVAGGDGLAPEGRASGVQEQAVGLINRARTTVEGVLELAGSTMGLSLRGITPLNGDGDYTIVFGCTVDGVPLGGGSQDAVVVQAESGRITSIEMTVMTLAEGEPAALLPYRQAAAALGNPAAGPLRLLPRYSRTGARLTPYLSYTAGEEAMALGMEKG